MKLFSICLLISLSIICCSCHSVTNTTVPLTNNDAPHSDSGKRGILDDTQAVRNVYDFVNLYTAIEQRRLDSTISDYTKLTGLRIVILTIDTTMASADDVEQFTQNFATEKKINTTIVIAPHYKKIHIWNDSLVNNTVLRQYETEDIIEDNFIPDFKSGRYFDGTFKGVQAIRNTIERKPKVTF